MSSSSREFLSSSRGSSRDGSSRDSADDAESSNGSSSDAAARHRPAPKTKVPPPKSRGPNPEAREPNPKAASAKEPKPTKAKEPGQPAGARGVARRTKIVERPPPPRPVRGKDKIGTFYRSGRSGRKCYYTPKDYKGRMAAIDKALRHSGYD